VKVFVIHRSRSRKNALKVVRDAGKKLGIPLELVILKSSLGSGWKTKAEQALQAAELILVYHPEEFEDSPNTSWELQRAGDLKKDIVELGVENDTNHFHDTLMRKYNFQDEFDGCFTGDQCDQQKAFDLYKVMVDTSEELVARRQRVNTFFVTIIGSLIALSGLAQSGLLGGGGGYLFLFLVSVAGIVLCYSWQNQLRNYGQLNTAKFKVINKLEESFPSQIFNAEWIAMGKGVRPKKYKSFTRTEQVVPYLFGSIMVGLLLLTTVEWLLFEKSGEQSSFVWLITYLGV